MGRNTMTCIIKLIIYTYASTDAKNLIAVCYPWALDVFSITRAFNGIQFDTNSYCIKFCLILLHSCPTHHSVSAIVSLHVIVIADSVDAATQ